ncbi:MAG: hypothetical protein IIZ59_02130 [Clostridia bacterium]|nr:hypothetical protein [Clostridia bacterium]
MDELKRELIDVMRVTGSVKDGYSKFEYNESSNTAKLTVKAENTFGVERSARISYVFPGTRLKFVRTPLKGNPENILITNASGAELGELPVNLCRVLAPMIDEGYPIINTVTANTVKSPNLWITLDIAIPKTGDDASEQCIVCLFGGDHVTMQAQELRVYTCDIPLNDAKLLFELYNKFRGEYERLTDGTFSLDDLALDNLAAEVRVSHEKMREQLKSGKDYSHLIPNTHDTAFNFGDYLERAVMRDRGRYGMLLHCVDKLRFDYDASGILTVLKRRSTSCDVFHWIDRTRVSEREWNAAASRGFSNWYQILELYPSNVPLPFDPNDAELSTIFGFGEFRALAILPAE